MDLVNIVTQGGPAVLATVLAFLYWSERSERKELQDKLFELQSQYLERMITGLNSAAQAARDAASAVQTLSSTFQTVVLQIRKGGPDV